MAPAPPRAAKALNTMKAIGFPFHVAKPVLKNLLKVYDNNWEYIESENYSVLADAILEAQESQDTGKNQETGKKKQDPGTNEEPEPSRKRLRKQSDQRASSSTYGSDDHGEVSQKRPKSEADVLHESNIGERGIEPASPLVTDRGKMAEPAMAQPTFDEITADVISHQFLGEENVTGIIPPQTSPIAKTTGNISPPPSATEKTTGHLSHQPSCQEPVASPSRRRETRASARLQQMSPAQKKSDSAAVMTLRRDKQPVHDKCSRIEAGIGPLPQKVTVTAPLRPKDEPVDDESPRFEVPIAMICPSYPMPSETEAHQYQPGQDNSSIGSASILQTKVSASSSAQNVDKENRKESPSDAGCKNGDASELVSVPEASSASMDIASSAMGEVKLSLSSDRADFRMPSLDSVFKMVEDRCLRSYKILQPDFSLMNLMKEMCQCALELGSEPTNDGQENIIKVTPVLESLKKSGVHSMFDGMAAFPLNGSVTMNGRCPNQELTGNNKNVSNGQQSGAPESSDTHGLSIVPVPHLAYGDIRPLHDANDVAKGEERVRIPIVNEIGEEKYPSSFHYIPRNVVYQNAYVNFSLARIGDEDCCSDCFGDCISAEIPCACARETGGEFAYTSEGVVRKEFLDECISMNRSPQKHHHFFCQVCPLERSKNDLMPDPCKGHLVRKFIKECWRKCGCSKQCGNRVVQRGITCNLQVFFTAEGKGWGVRTLDELPRGAFVCEYVGEVLTNMELYYRTIQSTANAKHTYPVLLDADWGSEGVLKDEEALCLDATFYGNVARFVNHRCFDANLVEIPVEVEAPDHHYYHLAFFTTRKIEAYEELTWDYGIDFDDHDHPIKAFKCRCGSKLCRDMKRSKTRSKAVK